MSARLLHRALLASLVAALLACDESNPRTGALPRRSGGGGSNQDADTSSSGMDARVLDGTAGDLGPGADSGQGGDVGFPTDAGGDDASQLADVDNSDVATGDAGGRDGGDGGGGDGGGRRDTGPAPTDAGASTCNPTFGMAEACGGAVAGTYTYVEGCIDPAVMMMRVTQNCPSATITNSFHTSSGTLEILGNGTFTRNVNNQTTGNVMVPALCAQFVGGCPGVETMIRSSFPGAAATCTTVGQDCDCAIAINVSLNDNGTYTTNNGIVTAHAGANTLEYYYCITGNKLVYHGLVSNPFDDEITYVLAR